MPGPRNKYKEWYKKRYGETPSGVQLPQGSWNASWKSVRGWRGRRKGVNQANVTPSYPAAAEEASDIPGKIEEIGETVDDIAVSESHVTRCRVYNDAAESIGNASWTALTFNSERWDNDGMHEGVTNPSRLTAVFGGPYMICGNVSFAANATGMRSVAIRLNGTTYLAIQHVLSMGASLTTNISIATHYNLAIDDYVELMVYQDSGGSLNVNAAGNYSPELSVVRF